MNTCILCGNQNLKILYKQKRINGNKITPTEAVCTGEIGARGKHGVIWHCANCGFIFQNPTFTKKELIEAYKKGSDERYFEQEEQRIRLFEKSLLKIEKFKNKKGKLLDIGAGAGLFLYVAKGKSWKVEGIEPSLWAQNKAKKKFGLNLKNGTFEKFKAKKNSFDVITMWDVLEHYKDPIAALKKARKLLKKDGIIAITTININSWFSKLLGSHWTWLIRIHLWYFTPQTLKKMMEKTGFKVEWMGGQTRWFSLPYLLSRFTGKNFSWFPKIILPAPTGDIIFVIARKEKF